MLMTRDAVIIPEVVVPDGELPRDLIALRRFAWLLDEAVPIPGTRRRVGLDAGLGLIPGIGDAIGAILSTWIVIGALRHRVPARKVVRMLFNIIIDLVIGALPVVGDVFDFLFEENVMNLDLLFRHRDRTRPPRSLGSIAGAALLVVGVIIASSLLTIAAFVAGVYWFVRTRF